MQRLQEQVTVSDFSNLRTVNAVENAGAVLSDPEKPLNNTNPIFIPHPYHLLISGYLFLSSRNCLSHSSQQTQIGFLTSCKILQVTSTGYIYISGLIPTYTLSRMFQD